MILYKFKVYNMLFWHIIYCNMIAIIEMHLYKIM